MVAVHGDGGFMFGVQEMATAVAHNIGVVALVFTDNAYGNVKRIQEKVYEGRTVASHLVNPDFVRLAESFGMRAERVTTPQALRPALKAAIKAIIDEESDVLSDDAIAAMLNDRGMDIARRTVVKYREAMGIGSSIQRRRQRKMAAG